MEITNTVVRYLTDSLTAAHLPFVKEYCADSFIEDATDLDELHWYNKTGLKDAVKTQIKLAQLGNGHNNFLKGITVFANFTSTIKWWHQAERYQFFTIVSSQSTMHCLSKMDIDRHCTDRVFPEAKEALKKAVKMYNDGIITQTQLEDNIPTGFQITASVVTNYMCLQNMYRQRLGHHYLEWDDFCAWVTSLPLAKELITGEDNFRTGRQGQLQSSENDTGISDSDSIGSADQVDKSQKSKPDTDI